MNLFALKNRYLESAVLLCFVDLYSIILTHSKACLFSSHMVSLASLKSRTDTILIIMAQVQNHVRNIYDDSYTPSYY